MGLPILVELTEAERNKLGSSNVPNALRDPNAPFGSGLLPSVSAMAGARLPPGARDRHAGAEIPYHRLYVGSLQFDLTAHDMEQVFAPFGEIEFVDLHRDPLSGKSKGFCFVQCVPPFFFSRPAEG